MGQLEVEFGPITADNIGQVRTKSFTARSCSFAVKTMGLFASLYG